MNPRVGQPVPAIASASLPSLLLTSPSVCPGPLGSSLQRLSPNCSSAAGEATLNSTVPEKQQSKGEESTDCDKAVVSNIGPTEEEAIPANVSENNQSTSASVAADYNYGNESDGSIEIVEPSKQEVIDVDDSDKEELSVSQPCQQSSAACTQTLLQKEDR